MSTPTTPDGPAEESEATADAGSAEQHPSLPTTSAGETADAAAPPLTGPPPPAGPPPGGPMPVHQMYPPYQPYGAGPFAPRMREPWFNPVKRGAITAAAIVLALVLFGGGIAIGAVVADDHGGSHPGLGPLGNHRNLPERGFGRDRVGGNAGDNQVRPGGFGRGHLPQRGNPSSSTPSPAPSTSHS